jgi:phosphate transport system substrate-binding protein
MVWSQPPQAVGSVADPYVPESLVTGELLLAGSRTMSQLAAVWTDGFRHIHPDVMAKFDFQGSETAFDQLAGEGATAGLLSRAMTPAEQDAFAKAHPGLKLVAVDAAFDAIAVVVALDHPVEALSIDQLKVLFSRSDKAATWGDVGVEGEWTDVPVVRFGPDENSGSRAQFFSQVLGAEGQPADLTPHAWHTQIIEDVAKTKGAIGFVSAANARTDKVRTLAIARVAGGPAVPLTPETIAAETYPLIRPLSLVVVLDDKGVRNPLVGEFVKYVLSRGGQGDVVKDGFQPLGRSHLLMQHDHLGWNQIK